jgi:hypothetical protein
MHLKFDHPEDGHCSFALFCENHMTAVELLNTILAIVALVITFVGFFASLKFYREGMNLQNKSNDAMARIEEMSRSLSTLIYGMFQQTLDAAFNREPQSGSISAPVQVVPPPRSEMEKKILNTLWTHQVPRSRGEAEPHDFSSRGEAS